MIQWRPCPRCGYPTALDKFGVDENRKPGEPAEICEYCLEAKEAEAIIREADPKDLLGLRVLPRQHGGDPNGE